MEKNRGKRKWLPFAILAFSLLFIGIGLIKQEYLEVWQKAVRICLECIGIG
jgi:hypothetical protein